MSAVSSCTASVSRSQSPSQTLQDVHIRTMLKHADRTFDPVTCLLETSEKELDSLLTGLQACTSAGKSSCKVYGLTAMCTFRTKERRLPALKHC